ncbi:hypothetical protein EW145_g6860 [Phellinidium pouzarii]|uniref:F-box domain-containing protein n=1 Tax=Phellinidium pouzarii TaxID=167371 RepID=A0A4S4KXE1_9AGAM|nr:hypothetical protein EW145_g6860 [Phellinidium pouzarii]
MASGITVDKDALDVLASALAVLGQEGNLDNMKLWSLTHVPESITSALCLLTRSCGKTLRTLQKRLRPFFLVGGIVELPDEILSYIFEFATPARYLRVPLVSQVCRRFRRLALNHPPLWACIHNHMPDDWIDTLLYRSGNAVLSIYFYEWDRTEKAPFEPSILDFINTVAHDASRWKSFNLELEDYGELALPGLQSLKIDVLSYVQDTTIDFYQHWKMPKLQQLFTGPNIPVETASLENLIDLSLKMIHAMRGTESIMETKLLKVNKLELETGGSAGLKFVMGSMLMPALKRMDITVHRSADVWIPLLSSKSCMSVEELNVKVKLDPSDFSKHERSVETSILFKNFPSLKRLSCPSVACPSFRDVPVIPPLQRIKLIYFKVDVPGLIEMRKSLDAQGRWKDFEFLEIEEGRRTLRKQAEEVFPKTQWASYVRHT